MRLPPYRWHDLEIPAPPDEVIRRLDEWTNPGLGEATSLGKVSEKRIHITRRSGYQNSFMPFLLGTVSPSIAGSRLRFRLGLHPVVVGFMAGLIPCAIWLSRNFPTTGPWVPGLMVALPVAAAIGTYYWEGPKLLRKVEDCLEIEPGSLGA